MNLKGKTNSELIAIREEICSDSSNLNTPGGIFIYTAKARKKLDEIDRAITANIKEARSLSGNPVVECGYSGRQTNKRR